MSDQPPIDLAFLGRQQEKILNELATMRDDDVLLLAIAIRMDGTLTGLAQEIRASHAQHSRLANRVTALEKAP